MKKNVVGILLLLFTGVIISFILFKPVLQDPNAYLFSKSGDAVKSYYNFSYYLRYDEGIRHDGINYPYGDHLQYINSHPLYVTILKFIDKNLVEISDYGPAILNLTMIFSLVLALPFIFLILRKFSLPLWYSFIISLIILYLTPQFDRIHGHFEMVYAFLIPLYFYLLILYLEGRRSFLIALLLVLGGLIGGFTSAYYVAFYAIFILAVLVVQLWINRNKLKDYKYQALYLFLIAAIPVIMVKGLVSLTDWVSDRPDNPWGFFVFHSNIFSIFLPFVSELKYIFGDPHFMRFEWEGRAYVGFPATILALIIAVSVLSSLFPSVKFRKKTLFPHKELNIFLAASILVLLFSMAFPFKYGFAFLRDLIPPLKQFRALGRFSWIFYYVFTTFTAYLIFLYYRYLQSKGLKVIALSLLFLSLGYWSIDAGMNIKRSVSNLKNPNDLLQASSGEYKEMVQRGGVEIDKYQAILFLPFANTCGDKLLFTRGMSAFNQAMKCSYHTGLPIVQSFSPRLSFSHALSSIQMLADPAIPKKRLEDMNDQPLLLLRTDQELTVQEKWLFDHAEKVFSYDNVTLAEIYPSTLRESHEKWQRKAKNIIENRLSYTGPTFRSDILPELIIHKNYNDLENSYARFQGNSFYQKSGEFFILSGDELKDLPSGKYKISFWLFVDTRTDNMPEAILYSWDGSGLQLGREKWNTREEHNVYKSWVRIDNMIQISPEIEYALKIKGKYISLDELLLQPENANVYVDYSQGLSLLNNFPYLHGSPGD